MLRTRFGTFALLLLAVTGAARSSESVEGSDLVGCHALKLTPTQLPLAVTGKGGFIMNPPLPTQVRLEPQLHPEFDPSKSIHVAARLDAVTPDPRQTWQLLEDGRLVLWMADGAYALRVVLQHDPAGTWSGTARPESAAMPIEYKTGTAKLTKIACPVAS